MNLTIILGGVTRHFRVEPEDIINNDWQAVLNDMLDTIEKAD